ncbi:hypothetical protein [Sediminicoccus rosea]|jgi:hypothetical protein|uniref:Uncharacterized protein n=1 Tax=Sediminicoccus rosea TaxID=1225128 RepID=A0ABZ0PDS6_9PROT|nr:hypothetical protein [Sediminicoccus rosea]WPB83577.1 hypothetical protein R9Z33_15860 [Sediminicoccus rosea]
MSSETRDTRGAVILTILRLGVLATASAMVGVLGHVAWRLVTA